MKNNTSLLYVIGGLLVGVLMTTCYFSFNSATRIQQLMGNYQTPQSNGMMHQMPNGTIMGGTVQMDMNSMMSGMMSGLNGKTGDEFDKAFLAEMIVHHQGAVVMAQAVLKNSKRPELIKLANDIISAQTGEITMMKNWQKSWFNIRN
jgi:uncharacterized protein (DUF305 family)